MKSRIWALVALTSGAVWAQGAIAFNNFGPGDSFDIGTGWTSSGPSAVGTPRFESACQFTAGATGNLDTITIAIGHVSGDNSAYVYLHRDSGDSIGSAMIGWYFLDLPEFGTAFSSKVLHNPFSDKILTAGEKYWVSVKPGAADTWNAWNWNDQFDVGRRGYSSDGGDTYTYVGDSRRGAMRVEVVPEPASMLALAGLAAWAVSRRRARL